MTSDWQDQQSDFQSSWSETQILDLITSPFWRLLSAEQQRSWSRQLRRAGRRKTDRDAGGFPAGSPDQNQSNDLESYC